MNTAINDSLRNFPGCATAASLSGTLEGSNMFDDLSLFPFLPYVDKSLSGLSVMEAERRCTSVWDLHGPLGAKQ